VLSALVAEELEDGDSKIHLAGLTGGHPAESVLGREQLAWGRRVGVRGAVLDDGGRSREADTPARGALAVRCTYGGS